MYKIASPHIPIEIVFCTDCTYVMEDTEDSFVNDFVESESDEEYQPPKKRSRRANLTWVKKSSFDSAKDAEDAVAHESVWRKAASNDTIAGVKIEYRCSLGNHYS